MTTNTTTAFTAADALKYAAVMLKQRTGWTGDSIAGSCCDRDGHEDELNCMNDAINDVIALAARFGDLNRYSNGRLVQSSAQIVDGLVTSHVWHPDATAEPPTSWRSALPSDPDVPSPGVYEVELDPVAQHIHIRVVRAV